MKKTIKHMFKSSLATVLALVMLTVVGLPVAMASEPADEDLFAATVDFASISLNADDYQNVIKDSATGATLILNKEYNATAANEMTYTVNANGVQADMNHWNTGGYMAYTFPEALTGKVAVSFTLKYGSGNFAQHLWDDGTADRVRMLNSDGDVEMLLKDTGNTSSGMHLGASSTAECTVDGCAENHGANNLTAADHNNTTAFKFIMDFDAGTVTTQYKPIDGEWTDFYGYNGGYTTAAHPYTMDLEKSKNLKTIYFNFDPGAQGNFLVSYLAVEQLAAGEAEEVLFKSSESFANITLNADNYQNVVMDPVSGASLTFMRNYTGSDIMTYTFGTSGLTANINHWNTGGYMAYTFPEALTGKVAVSFSLRYGDLNNLAGHHSPQVYDIVKMLNSSGDAEMLLRDTQTSSYGMHLGADGTTSCAVAGCTENHGNDYLRSYDSTDSRALDTNDAAAFRFVLDFDAGTVTTQYKHKTSGEWTDFYGYSGGYTTAAHPYTMKLEQSKNLKTIYFNFDTKAQGTFQLSDLAVEQLEAGEEKVTLFESYENFLDFDLSTTKNTNVITNYVSGAELTFVNDKTNGTGTYSFPYTGGTVIYGTSGVTAATTANGGASMTYTFPEALNGQVEVSFTLKYASNDLWTAHLWDAGGDRVKMQNSAGGAEMTVTDKDSYSAGMHLGASNMAECTVEGCTENHGTDNLTGGDHNNTTAFKFLMDFDAGTVTTQYKPNGGAWTDFYGYNGGYTTAAHPYKMALSTSNDLKSLYFNFSPSAAGYFNVLDLAVKQLKVGTLKVNFLSNNVDEKQVVLNFATAMKKSDLVNKITVKDSQGTSVPVTDVAVAGTTCTVTAPGLVRGETYTVSVADTKDKSGAAVVAQEVAINFVPDELNLTVADVKIYAQNAGIHDLDAITVLPEASTAVDGYAEFTNHTGKAQTVKLFVAYYTGAGVLVKGNVVSKTIPAYSSDYLRSGQMTASFKDCGEGGYAKVFVWSNNLMPMITTPVTYGF